MRTHSTNLKFLAQGLQISPIFSTKLGVLPTHRCIRTRAIFLWPKLIGTLTCHFHVGSRRRVALRAICWETENFVSQLFRGKERVWLLLLGSVLGDLRGRGFQAEAAVAASRGREDAWQRHHSYCCFFSSFLRRLVVSHLFIAWYEHILDFHFSVYFTFKVHNVLFGTFSILGMA